MNVQLWFYKGRGKFFDKIIRWWTGGPYSHVEIVIDGTAYSADAWNNVVRAKSVNEFNRDNWDRFEVVGQNRQERLNMCIRLCKQLGKQYDWLGILGFAFGGVQDPDRWYCSELCAWLLGIEGSRMDPNRLFSVVTSLTIGGND